MATIHAVLCKVGLEIAQFETSHRRVAGLSLAGGGFSGLVSVG